MKKVPKMAISTFERHAWNDKLLALNPWALKLTLSEQDATLIAARRAATLKRLENKEDWNKWSERMLALNDDLKDDYERIARSGKTQEIQVWDILSKADFIGHTFKHNVDFSNTLFVGNAAFKKAVFLGDAKFNNTKFRDGPDFNGASFASWVDFNGANFSCPHDSAWFSNATFAKVAYFRGSEFFGNADFQNSTFSDKADFSGAIFKFDAIFTKAKFEHIAFFIKAKFERVVLPVCPGNEANKLFLYADFSEASFVGAADFEDAVFCGLATFDCVSSMTIFSLKNTQFKEVPSLFGATFRALRLDNMQTPRNGPLGWTKDKDAPAGFRELRRRAIEGKDPERELEFFAQEIRTWRFHSKWLMPRVWDCRFYFGLAYGALSDFGRSILRPVLCWLALLLLCAALYLGANEDMRKARAALNPSGTIETLVAYAKTTRAALTNPPQCMDRGLIGTTNPVIEAILLSLQNALIFESARPEANRRTLACLYGPEDAAQEKYSIMSSRVSFISTLQSLASGVLIFLLLLATRNLLRLR
jgi:uncharacterized protein YjbI with pentapeptide repeats